MSIGRNWFLMQIIEYFEDIISGFIASFEDLNKQEDPDPPDNELFKEAMELGIDPATIPPDKLRQVIMDERAKINT